MFTLRSGSFSATMNVGEERTPAMSDITQLSTAAPAAIHSTDEWATSGGGTRTLYERRLKRFMDVNIALAALLVLLPLMLIIAATVRVFLGSGVLYRQARVGRDGRNFVMLKFRTMQHETGDATEVTDHSTTHKSGDHPRATRVGRWLRKLSLDELPQLWNVLRGQMSLVGPRPELSEKVDAFGLRRHERHLVRPGLTGQWQVTHRSSGIHLIHCFDDDMKYLHRVTLRRDLAIMAKTLVVVFRGKGF
jgi:lipopolysaccharide/colanic/teichoic acid biosynthesis glycosyltransferase